VSNILLCVCGSVAAKLTPTKTFPALQKVGFTVAATTESGCEFFDPSSPSIYNLCYTDKIAFDLYKWCETVLHIELVKLADVVVFAPLSANTLSKMSLGICDNLVTTIARALDPSTPIVLAPAMNPAMWNNPFTEEALERLQSKFRNLVVVDPVEKTLACGVTGVGAMAHTDTIAEAVKRALTIDPRRTDGEFTI
jgi:phosphopantothenoylcysteine decarboxylase